MYQNTHTTHEKVEVWYTVVQEIKGYFYAQVEQELQALLNNSGYKYDCFLLLANGDVAQW